MNNAIVVMFDSLQKSYLGCYGNSWIKTPNFDRFSREGITFDNQYIEGVPTVPCRRAMHTGRYTLPVGGWIPLSMEDTTIADLCWGRPIDTALIFDCPMYRLQKFGYTRGFDKVWFFHGHEGDHEFYNEGALYHLDPMDYIENTAYDAYKSKTSEHTAKTVVHEISCYLKQSQYWNGVEGQRPVRLMNQAIDYLKQVDRNKQFYLWIDCFDPHEPWDTPSIYDKNMPSPYNPDYKGKDIFLPFSFNVEGIYTEEQLHHVRMLYAENVTLCDTYFGMLIDAIRDLGFEENTLVMMVSDHGEPMGNGEHGHGIMRKCRPWPYDELVHAPMIIRGPHLPAGKRISAFTQSVDVAPTVCDWLGIGVHPDMQGKSLLPLIRGEVDKIRDFAIAGYFKFSWSIITEKWSYIHWPVKEKTNTRAASVEFYGLDKDGNFGTSVRTNEALQRHKEAANLDGESQWTCTPGSVAQVPEHDELYSCETDPHQLNNVISKNPEVASALLQQLRGFMSELRAS